ncbi:hypothetical protein [Bacillus sp. FJAT-28004]|uniref:hypothetical protein n=1 Tax=Bacillus sp. FJAT-28004 TaxID=1679165 RepID=UPI0006B4B0A8|nr:hypothetical protein [Bacillus sp. FJAT-28004]
MSDGSLRAKQEKLQLEGRKTNSEVKTSHTEEGKIAENNQTEGSIPEWQRFYEVIRGITSDMRY